MTRAWTVAAILFLSACASQAPVTGKKIDRHKLSRIYATKGAVYLAEGNLKTALHDLRKALDLNPDNTAAIGTLAVLYERLDMPEEAARHYRRAIRLQSNDPTLLNNYGRFLCARGRYDEGIVYLLKASRNKLYEKRWIALVNAGECAMKAGRYQEAETWLRESLRLQPETPVALAALATLMAERKEWLSARAFLQRYEAVAPLPSEAMIRLGYRVETALGASKSAQKYLEKLHRLKSP